MYVYKLIVIAYQNCEIHVFVVLKFNHWIAS